MKAASLETGQNIPEAGAGVGRVAFRLVGRGLDLTCLGVSPVMLAMVARNASRAVGTVVADVAGAGRHLLPKFDRAISFVILHEMPWFETVFKGTGDVLKLGALPAFGDRRRWNPRCRGRSRGPPG